MCQNYLVMSQYTRHLPSHHQQKFMKNVRVQQHCVDFFIAKFTQVRFSDLLLYELLSEEVSLVKIQYKMDFCVNFFSEHDILAPEYFISEVRWKPFVEGISANLIASSDA